MGGHRLSVGLRSAGANEMVALAEAAEREALDGIWLGCPWDRDDQGDSFRTMVAAAIAARTSYARIGCVLTLQDPAGPLRLAEDIAMIDQASRGRVELLLVVGDAATEHRAAQLLEAWRGWRVADGRSIPVTPRPLQPCVPRLVLAADFDESIGARLGAGTMVRSDDLAGESHPRARLGRRVVAFQIGSIRGRIAAHPGAKQAVAEMRDVANRCEADEVAIWLDAASGEALVDEVRLLARVVAPALASGDVQWEMLAELGARAARRAD